MYEGCFALPDALVQRMHCLRRVRGLFRYAGRPRAKNGILKSVRGLFRAAGRPRAKNAILIRVRGLLRTVGRPRAEILEVQSVYFYSKHVDLHF